MTFLVICSKFLASISAELIHLPPPHSEKKDPTYLGKKLKFPPYFLHFLPILVKFTCFVLPNLSLRFSHYFESPKGQSLIKVISNLRNFMQILNGKSRKF